LSKKSSSQLLRRPAAALSRGSLLKRGKYKYIFLVGKKLCRNMNIFNRRNYTRPARGYVILMLTTSIVG
jgi:hypothetical protein